MSSQSPEWILYHRLRGALPANVRVNVADDVVRQCVSLEVTPEFGYGEPIQLRVPYRHITGEQAERRATLGRLVTGISILVGTMRPPPRPVVVRIHADASGFANAMAALSLAGSRMRDAREGAERAAEALRTAAA